MNDAPTEALPTADVPAPPAVQPQAVPVGAARSAGACRSCSAPLAADQRYCLNCGARVAAPRVDWAGALGGTASGGAQPAAPTARGQWALQLDRIGGPMGAAAVVLVALAVGFLLGQGGNGSSGPATIVQRPPIVNVQSGAPAATGTTAGASTNGSASKHGKHSKIPTVTGNDRAGGDLNRLRAQPTEQSTGGTPPKTDHKPSGGGSSTETIG